MDVRPSGDSAFLIRLGAKPSRDLSLRIAALRRALLDARPPGLIDAIVGFVTLTIIYDPDTTDIRALGAFAEACFPSEATAARCRAWRIPVCYEGDYAPDLPEVAAATGLAPEEVVRLHLAPLYTVYMLGFSPGFPYLGDLDPRLVLPRRSDPRPRIPAGAVAIATGYTAIYPQETPGGWHVLGRTPVRLFDPGAEHPALLGPGDSVRFVAIGAREFDEIAARVRAGVYAAEGDSGAAA